MTKTIKRLLVAGLLVMAVGLLALGLLGWWGYRWITGPMYRPGSLASVALRDPPPQDPDDPRWRVERRVHLHHFSRGRGRPVLFVHGGPGVPTREPMQWLTALDDVVEMHFYDQRGCGLSTRPFDRFDNPNFYANLTQLETTLGLQAQIADIERIRRVLGEEKLVLVGHSFGGFIAALYAAEFPTRVDKLVLLAPADVLVLPHEGADLFALVRERLPTAEHAAYDAFMERYLDFSDLFDSDEAELARRHVELGNYILRAMERDPVPEPGTETGGWMVNAMYFSMGKHHDYTPALSRIEAETLVVHGGRDIQPVSAVARYAEGIRGARLVEVPDADHFFLGEHRPLAEAVRAMVAGD